MRTRRALPGLLLALACIAALPHLAEAQEPKRGGALRVAYGNEISNLDFYTAPGYELNWVAMNIGCGLLGITPDGKFVPSAAESWQTSPDGLLYTFKLRKNGFLRSRPRPLWRPRKAVRSPCSSFMM